LPQLSKVESSRSVRRAPRLLSETGPRGRANAARVIVAWSPANEDSALGLEPTQVELEAELAASAATTWTCRQPSGSGWAEELSSARCSEVVLTAQLDDDLPAKHLVLELAGLLALKLAATQPLIRVRFLPPSERTAPRLRRRATELNSSAKR
jgi:hypothetical protein